MSAPAHGRRAAAPASRVLAQARYETLQLLRHGEQLLVSVVLPVLALVALALSEVPALGAGRRIDLATAGVLGLAVISTALTGQAILLAYERRYGVLRLVGTTPLGRSGLVAAKALSVLSVLAVQVLTLSLVAAGLGWRPVPTGLPLAAGFLLLGAWTFTALAMLLGGTLRAEGVLAVANLLWVLLLTVGGVVLPAAELPGGWGAVVSWLPSAALGDGLRAALTGGGLDVGAASVLVGWGLLASAAASRLLRWSD